MKYWNGDIEKLKRAEPFEADALLLGRVTYQVFADSWPHRSGEWADRMNSLPKHVATTTLKDLAWNNSHLIKGDLAQQVVYPIALGSGKRPLKDGTTATLTLTESRTCHPNVVFVRYPRAR